jgi:hypothetical protein
VALDTLLSLIEILLTSSVAHERGEIISSMARLALNDLLAEIEAGPDLLDPFLALRVTRAADLAAQIHPTPDNEAWAREVSDRAVRLAHR